MDKKNTIVPFISEVEKFNEIMGKPEANQPEPTVSNEKTHDFIYNFILEELNEYKESCKEKDIVGIADSLGDIMYVLCNGILAHGLKDKFEDIYEEIQQSNLSKVCESEDEAKQTMEVRGKEQGEACHFEKHGDYWIVYRTRDKKVQKSILYFKPNLSKFFEN
jgi:predicted HAD superfamily Cof-like phosphohydrolase